MTDMRANRPTSSVCACLLLFWLMELLSCPGRTEKEKPQDSSQGDGSPERGCKQVPFSFAFHSAHDSYILNYNIFKAPLHYLQHGLGSAGRGKVAEAVRWMVETPLPRIPSSTYFSNSPPSIALVFKQPQLQILRQAHLTCGALFTFEDGFRALVGFPILGRSRFRCEKTNDELLTMAFLARKTCIPVPTVLGTGKWGCGPYIVTTVIEGTLLSKCLRDPSVLAPSLNPDVSELDLERAYSGMAQLC